MTVKTGHIPALLEEGLNDIYGQNLARYPDEWKSLFEEKSTNKNSEVDQLVVDLGVMTVKSEGGGIDFDEFKQGYKYRYVMISYALGVGFTEEAIDDNLYMSQLETAGQMLAKSDKETRNIVAHNILNRAFNSSYTYADGKELCATNHPFIYGGTWKNELTTAANFNEATAEQAIIDIGGWVDHRGKKVVARPVSLHVPIDLEFDCERFLNSTLRPGVSENDLNALKSLNKFPGGVHVHHYLTDSNAWFIKTDQIKGLKYFNRKKSKISSDNVFTSGDVQFKLTARYAFGASDPHQIFGSPGA